MSWLEQLHRPNPHPSQHHTTIVLHRNDSDTPLIHHLQGLHEGKQLHTILQALVQEYFDEYFEPTVAIVWQKGPDTWEEDFALDLRVNGA
ncbi:MAG: hypothetical protein ACO395_07970 [Pontimonas sp.]